MFKALVRDFGEELHSFKEVKPVPIAPASIVVAPTPIPPSLLNFDLDTVHHNTAWVPLKPIFERFSSTGIDGKERSGDVSTANFAHWVKRQIKTYSLKSGYHYKGKGNHMYVSQEVYRFLVGKTAEPPKQPPETFDKSDMTSHPVAGSNLTEDELRALSIDELMAVKWRLDWKKCARPKQMPPEDPEWKIWMILAGRGFGKTRIGAEACAWYAWRNAGARIALIGPTTGDVRDTLVEGVSGIISVIPPKLIAAYNRSLLEVTLTNGSKLKGFSAQEPDRLRGPQHHMCLEGRTAIATPEGNRPLKDIQVGDKVVTRMGPRRVIAAGKSNNPHNLVSISYGKMSLTGTEDHPIMIEGKGWTALGKLSIGDRVLGLPPALAPAAPHHSGQVDGTQGSAVDPVQSLTTAEITSVKHWGRTGETYNLTVEGEHEYFANGVLVHNCWMDEMAAFPKETIRDVWDMMHFGLRLGTTPKLIITTTPKPIPMVREIIQKSKDQSKGIYITTGSTYENRVNLAGSFFDQIAQYEGTQIGRQEIHAEVLDPEETGIIKRSWFKLWPAKKELPIFEYVIQSYDTAFTEKTQNDPTGCTVWGVFKMGNEDTMGVLLCDAWVDHLAYPELRQRAIVEYQTQYGDNPGRRPDVVLIEEKGSGISLIQDLRRGNVPVRPYNPGKADKTQRLHAVSHLILNGRCFIPESSTNKGQPRDWVEPFLNQVCSFPLVDHDEFVDTTSQALALLRDQSWLSIDPQDDDFDFDYVAKRRDRSNPYAI